MVLNFNYTVFFHCFKSEFMLKKICKQSDFVFLVSHSATTFFKFMFQRKHESLRESCCFFKSSIKRRFLQKHQLINPENTNISVFASCLPSVFFKRSFWRPEVSLQSCKVWGSSAQHNTKTCETNKHVTTSRQSPAGNEQAAIHTETTVVSLGMKRRNVLVFIWCPSFSEMTQMFFVSSENHINFDTGQKMRGFAGVERFAADVCSSGASDVSIIKVTSGN